MTGIDYDDISFISDDNNKWDILGPQLIQGMQVGQPSKIATGQAPAGITTPPPPAAQAAQATQAAQAAQKPVDLKQDLQKKIEAYDPETNITGEAKTTYEDLFGDERTSSEKAKDFLLNNAINIAEVIGGGAGAGKTLPRFMLSDELIQQSRDINERAQTGLTAEEKSSMTRDAIDKEQSAYNFLGKSGLSSGQMLGIAPKLQRQTQDQKLKIDILDQQTKEQHQAKAMNMERYLSDLQYKTQFMPDYQEAQMDRQAAGMTAQAGFQGIQEGMLYDKQYGEGSNYAALQEATMRNILEDVRAKEMGESKSIRQAEYLDLLDLQKQNALQGIGAMTQQQLSALNPNDIQAIIK